MKWNIWSIGFITLFITQIILIVLKIIGELNITWWLILLPVIIFITIIVTISIICNKICNWEKDNNI